VGGMERVKFGLTATSDLGEAAQHLSPGVIAARAMQHGDSTGAVDWSDTSSDGYIQIRVIARTGGTTRVYQASFTPTVSHALYRDVLATTGPAAVDMTAASFDKTSVSGTVRQNGPDTGIWDSGSGLGGVHSFLGAGVPRPEADDFIATYAPGANPPS